MSRLLVILVILLVSPIAWAGTPALELDPSATVQPTLGHMDVLKDDRGKQSVEDVLRDVQGVSKRALPGAPRREDTHPLLRGAR